MISKQIRLKIAFDDPETGPACAKVGQLLIKKLDEGFDLGQIAKKTKKDESEVMHSLHRLTNNVKILEYYLDAPDNIETLDAPVTIPVKYRFKKEYQRLAQSYFQK